jgi:hypothetical protein
MGNKWRGRRRSPSHLFPNGNPTVMGGKWRGRRNAAIAPLSFPTAAPLSIRIRRRTSIVSHLYRFAPLLFRWIDRSLDRSNCDVVVEWFVMKSGPWRSKDLAGLQGHLFAGLHKAHNLNPDNVPTSQIPAIIFHPWIGTNSTCSTGSPCQLQCWNQPWLMYSLRLPKDNTFKGPNLKGRWY